MAMGVYPSWYRLPQKHCTEIGRIVTRFAALESKVAYCAYTLLNIGKKQGRVAVRTGRIESALTVVQDLLTISKITVGLDIPKMKTAFKELERARDLISHCVWVKHTASKSPVAQMTSGSYSPEEGGQAKARIDPQGIGVTVLDLRKTVKAIDRAVRAVDRLGKEIDAAKAAQRLALQQKSPAPPNPRNQLGHRHRKGRQPRRPPSPA